METKLNINAIPDGSIGKDKFTEEVRNLINNSEINHGTSDTTFTLTPNTFHVWDEVTSLDLSFGEETEGIANEFLFQFTSGATATTLILPDTIKWTNDEVPTIEVNKIYQVSILKELASCLIFPAPYFNSNLNYFSIVSLEDNSTISLPTNTSPNLMYSLNETTWKKWNYSTINLNNGDILYLKGDNSNRFSISNSKYNNFSITGKVELGGNIMSLLYGDNFENNNTLPGTFSFNRLFYNCTGIISAKDLILPATTLTNYCYQYMFYGCTSLTEAPQLPATTLKDYCYSDMLGDCTSLTEAPQLSATTLANYCYSEMFYGCTSLTEAPQLPATTLKNYCYSSMFSGCTSLTTSPQLPATTLASYCYQSMFRGCTSLTEAPQLLATTLADHCYNGMFHGCTLLIEAPELLVTTLANNCYHSMFYNCTSLTTAPQLPATTLAYGCYQSMFRGCTSLTEAPQLLATTLAEWCYYNMFYSCSKLNHITMLATDISATNCLNYWVYGVASNGTFVKNPSMTTLQSGISGIPSGWTVEDYGGYGGQ